MLSTFAGYTPPTQNTWIQLFGLVYPLLFMVNIILLIYWLMIKSKLAFLPVIIMLVGSNNIFDNFQMSFFNTSSKQTGQIKVLTYNVKNFGERAKTESKTDVKNGIIDFLLEQNADIVCLQEYYSTNNSLYEPLKEIRDTLLAETYYYESYFNPKYNQLTGLVTFSKYKAINKGKLKFTGSRTFGIYTDVIINMDTVRIYNIHLASIKLGPGDIDFVVNPDNEDTENIKNHSLEIYNKLLQAYKLREKQMEQLIKLIESTKYKIILCGDFNDTPSSWVYNQLNNYLSDAFVKKGNGIGGTYAGSLPFLRIDYILTDESFGTCGYTRHNLKKSDHFPISAIIEKAY